MSAVGVLTLDDGPEPARAVRRSYGKDKVLLFRVDCCDTGRGTATGERVRKERKNTLKKRHGGKRSNIYDRAGEACLKWTHQSKGAVRGVLQARGPSYLRMHVSQGHCRENRAVAVVVMQMVRWGGGGSAQQCGLRSRSLPFPPPLRPWSAACWRGGSPSCRTCRR